MTDSLLPPNATQLETQLEQTLARIEQVPLTAISTLQSPQNIPSAALPWLAWAFSVDNWDESWSDAQKRAVVASSYVVHCQKGTVGAITSALNALGLGLVLTEWFNMNPPGAPYTFSVSMNVSQSDITQAQLQQAQNVIASTKNLRSHLTGLTITLQSQASVYHAGACGFGNTITIGSG